MAETSGGGIGILGILTIIFVVLKLTGNITWSWFWVLSPLILGLAIWLVIISLALGFFALVAYLTHRKR